MPARSTTATAIPLSEIADAAALMTADTSSGVSVCAKPPREVCENNRTDAIWNTETPMPASAASVTIVRARGREDGLAG